MDSMSDEFDQRPMTRAEAVAFAVAALAMFYVAIPVIRFLHWLTEPNMFTRRERRFIRGVIRDLTNPRIQAIWADVAFWLLLIATIAMGYLWSSFECSMGRDCFIASADLANWFFGK